MIRYLALFACLASLLSNVGCASVTCSSSDAEPPLIRVAHLSGGDGPVIHLLQVSQAGQARLEKVGFRDYCRRVSRDELEAVRSLVERTAFEEIAWSPGTGLHQEEAHVFAQGVEVRVVLPDPPEDLVPLFETLDDVFDEHFGWRYNMPLLSK